LLQRARQKAERRSDKQHVAREPRLAHMLRVSSLRSIVDLPVVLHPRYSAAWRALARAREYSAPLTIEKGPQ
jgi:hypothetical protein